jgi:hypothetical protein
MLLETELDERDEIPRNILALRKLQHFRENLFRAASVTGSPISIAQ